MFPAHHPIYAYMYIHMQIYVHIPLCRLMIGREKNKRKNIKKGRPCLQQLRG
jgi:hypothetical protein